MTNPDNPEPADPWQPSQPQPSQPPPPPPIPPPPIPPPPVPPTLPPQSGYPTYPQHYPYGYPPQRATSGKAIAVLVLGIVGLVLLCGYGIGLIPAIVALALAPSARREIASSGGRVDGDAFIKAGVICSWITVGLVLAFVAFFAVVLVIGAAASA